MKRIYLDYASLTPIDRRVLAEINKYSKIEYANPSSIYREGVAAKKALDEGRKKVADFINAHSDEIIFTSGGTEANALAIEGAGRAASRAGNDKPHFITTDIEHSSVREMAGMLEKRGVEVTRLQVGPSGIVDVDELKKAIKPSTFMVSVMTVNNEVGTIQPIREIAKAIRHAREHVMPQGSDGSRSRYPLLHTDAAQAAQYLDLNVEQLGVDLMTLDGGKAYGPRGSGALFIKRGTPIEQISYGGGQEGGIRSGTENLPAVMGLAKAFELCLDGREKESKRVQELKDYFLEGLKNIRQDVDVNPRYSDTSDLPLAPNILNIHIPGIDNEFFTLQLDAMGIAISTKSSCLKDEDESYVLKAIGGDSKASVRFSFGRWTKKSDIKTALKAIKAILARDIS